MEGVWMVGIVDEVRMPKTEVERNPMLVDTKTRVRDTLPSEPQRRNGRYVYNSGCLSLLSHYPDKYIQGVLRVNANFIWTGYN